MAIYFESGYSLPGGDEPLSHARIAHASNWHSGGTGTGSSTDSDFSDQAPLNSLTYEYWKPVGSGSAWEYDAGSSITCDYMFIAAHDFGTTGSTAVLQYYNGSSWAGLVNNIVPTDDSPILAIFAPVTAQRWRVLTTFTTAPKLSVMRVGSAMQFPRPMFQGHVPISLARESNFSTNFSHTGEFLGRSVSRRFLKTEFSWNNLDASWVNSEFASFVAAAEEEPFLIAWRPDDYVDVGYGVLEQPLPQPVYSGPRDLMSVSFNMRARYYD